VVKPGESVTCTFTSGTTGLGAGGLPPSTVHPPPGTVHVIPSFNPIVLNPTPRIDVTPSSQPRPVTSVAPTIASGTDGGASPTPLSSPSPSGLFGKALPATSGESAAGGFSPLWLLLVVGVLGLLFLVFFLWRRRKEREHEPST
jgi:hypothetical protein